MRWIYLSPHLDDAVLSGGGLIYEQSHSGIPVEICTFMCGYAPQDAVSPLAPLLHTQWGFSSGEDSTRMRREEDQKSAAIVGAKTVHFDFLDCIYRRGARGEWLYSDISVPPHQEDLEIPSQIAEAVSARLARDDMLVCQLSVGSHVDHVLMRWGAELLGRRLLHNIAVLYIFYKPEELQPKSAGMQETVYPITEARLRSWNEAVLAYKSQIPLLGDAFNTPEKVRETIQS